MKNKELVICLLKKCGIATNVGGNENNELNMRLLDGYRMPLLKEEYHLKSKNEDDERGGNDGNKMGEYKDDEMCGHGTKNEVFQYGFLHQM